MSIKFINIYIDTYMDTIKVTRETSINLISDLLKKIFNYFTFTF